MQTKRAAPNFGAVPVTGSSSSRKLNRLELALRDLVLRHHFQRAHHAGMIPRLAAMGRAGTEQLLGQRRARQRKPEGPRALQRQIEILLVQLDAKTRLEIALDHALA